MRKNKVFTPPYNYDNGKYTIDGVLPLNLFLAGTIDNGDSLEWGKTLIGELNSCDTVHPIMIYNPRREDWPDSNDNNEIEKQMNGTQMRLKTKWKNKLSGNYIILKGLTSLL